MGVAVPVGTLPFATSPPVPPDWQLLLLLLLLFLGGGGLREWGF